MSTRRVLVVAAVLSATVACAGPAAGPANPSSESTSAPVTYRFPPDAVPADIRVHEPKDARGIPYCDLLTREQLVALGLRPETVRPEPTEPGVGGCDWEPVDDPDNLAGITVRVDSRNPALRGIYIMRNGEHMFEPTQVAGHPAVAIRDRPASGCVLDVGIADDQLLSAGANVADRPVPDDCERARRIAEAVLANLPPRTRS